MKIIFIIVLRIKEIAELRSDLATSVEALSGNDSRIENILIEQIDQVEKEIVVVQGDITNIQNDVINIKEMPIGKYMSS